MSYKTVGEILDVVSTWQTRIADYCEEAADAAGDGVGTDDPRKRAMMDYFAEHEEQAEAVLAQSDATARKNIRETWLQYTPDEEIRAVFKEHELDPDAPFDEVVSTVIAFDDALMSLYRSLAEGANTPPKVAEFFRSLLDMQEWQTLRNAWSARESASYAEGGA